MMYLGIDQHPRQLTISLRDESGDLIQARQVSTQPEKVQAFLASRATAYKGVINYLSDQDRNVTLVSFLGL